MLAKYKNKKTRGVVFSALIVLADSQSVSYLHKKKAATLHTTHITLYDHFNLVKLTQYGRSLFWRNDTPKRFRWWTGAVYQLYF